jgi:lactoylglutathione lyase
VSRSDAPAAATGTGTGTGTEATAAPYSPRYLHVMLRVRDLDAMLGFYCGRLGMCEQRRIEFPAQRYTLVFIGYGEDAGGPQLELWQDWDAGLDAGGGAHTLADAVARADAPGHAAPGGVRRSGFGHVGIGVRNIDDCVRDLAGQGVAVLREPGAIRPGGRRIALLADPEGNEVELLATD